MTPNFTEQAVLFGSRRSLVGIVTRPAAETPPAEPAVVILNTGITHRVGHHRMYVTLSRQLAGAGRTVLRFDFSGIGDSYHRPDIVSPLKSTMADLKDALDMLHRDYGVSHAVLIGLCSGADHAVLYARADARVTGLVLLDPTLPPTARYYLHYIAQRFNNLRHWISVATGRSGLLRMIMRRLRHEAAVPGERELSLDTLQFSPHLGRCYKQAVDRGVQILAAFTSPSPRHSYRQQMLDAFPQVPFNDQLKLEHFPQSDHIFTSRNDRVRLTRAIVDWLPAEPASA